MKKRIISLIALVVLGLMTAFAQVPTTPLTYQTVVRNAQNQLVINQENVTVTVSVWNGAGTSELYRETHSGLSTNANGLLTLMMGTGTVNLGTWDDIDWSDASIKTTVSYNPGDGTVTINSAPAPVTAVPYAIQAGNATPQVQANWTEADNTQASFIQNKPNLATVATSGDYNDLTNKPTIPDAQVNADWNATSGVSQILNKPDLSVYATNAALNDFQTATNNTLTGINSNITNLQTQITSNDNDILALQNSDVTINNRITTDSAALHNALIDTAAAIRGDIHNATLTIQTNGTTTGTFTANQATNATINIDVPAAQVQSNWTEADNTQASFIQNKPTLATVATSGSYNDLSDQPAINNATLTIKQGETELGTFTANQGTNATITVPTPAAQVQSNWAESDNTSAAYIQNKPAINDGKLIVTYGTGSPVIFTANQAGNTEVTIPAPAAQVQADWTEDDNTSAAYIQHKPTLATVATSGSYNDLSNTPAINNATLTIKQGENTLGTFTANASEAATITVPTPAAQVQADWNENDNTQASFIQNKPAINNATLTIKQGETTLGTFTANASEAATITVPTPAAQVQANWTEADNTQASFIQNKPTLATVATSGSYNDLSDQPAINDATLTIQKNGTEVGTFTANQASAATINVTVPTTVAELTDAGNYATLAGDNHFTGANDFTAGSITVPNAITDFDAALTSPCTQDAVSLCDLLDVYNRLNERIAYLEAVVSSVVESLDVPTVTTSQASSVSASKAIIGGVLVSAGSATVAERGLCYSTSNNDPSITDTKQSVAGTNVGAFSYTLEDLPENTTYYVKAYATTSDDHTYYGDVITFTTGTPTLAVTADPTTPLVACDHADVTYTATMTNDQLSNYELKWYVNSVEQTGETNTTFAVHYDASITDQEVKCVATRAGGSAVGTITMDITVNPNPTITLTRLEGNAGDDWGKVEITAATNVASASWKLNDEEVGTWTSGKTEVLPAGNYSVVLTSDQSCEVTENITVRTTPICIAVTDVNTTLETTYELAGKQYVKTIKDHEGNVYNVLQVGSVCWTRENMRAVTSPTTGSTLITNGTAYQSKSAQWPYNDPVTYTANKYGVLYNWCAALDVHHASYPEIAYSGEESLQVVLPHPTANHRGICPEGWHVPVNNDYVNLNTLFPKGGQWATGSDWTSGTAQGPGDMSYAQRNLSGFSALPAGMNPDLTTGVPNYFHQTAWFVTATEYSATQNWRSPTLYVYRAQNSITGSWNTSWTDICMFNHQRYSVRCVRNTGASMDLYQSAVSKNTPVTYTANIVNDDASNYTFTWKVNDVVQDGETSSTFTKTYTTGGRYNVVCQATGPNNFTKSVTAQLNDEQTITTSDASDVIFNAATAGGNVTYVGYPAITERGVCYSTTAEPTISDTKVAATGAGAGEFTVNLTQLTPSTTYHLRAYATSSTGTVYGNEIEFTTTENPLSVTSDNGTEPVISCANEPASVTYTATMTGVDIADYTLQWFVNDAEQTGATAATFTASHATSSEYTVVCKATDAGNNFVTASTSVNVEVKSAPWPELSYTCLGGNAGDDWGKVEITDASHVLSASWIYEGEEIGTWVSGRTTVLPADNVNVILTSHQGCKVTLPITIPTSPFCAANYISGTETYYEFAGKKFVRTIKDHENNEYNVVQIGSTCWTRENMRATKSADGTDITNGDQSSSSTNALYYSYDNVASVGRYYNYPAAMTVCPTGWHLPTKAEFNTLWNDVNTNFTSSECSDYTAVALAATSGWETTTESCAPGTNQASNNVSGFSMVPAGQVFLHSGVYDAYNRDGYSMLWSATPNGGANAYLFQLEWESAGIAPDGAAYSDKSLGASVRCVRNTTASLGLSRTPATQQVASGTSVTYTATIANDDPAGYTYTWKVDGTAQGGSSATFNHTFSAGGTHTVSCEATGNGNTLTQSLTIVVAVSPEVSTSTVSGIGLDVATAGGDVTSDGGATVTARGVCYGTTANPDLTGNHAETSGTTGAFSVNLTGLNESTTYYVRAYATNIAGTSYGDEVSFTTLSVPTVSTSATAVTGRTGAKSGGNVTSDGGAEIIERGLVYGTSAEVTLETAAAHVAASPATRAGTRAPAAAGEYNVIITGLEAGHTYYVRAYATNSVGTGYGDALQITMAAPPAPFTCGNTLTDLEGNNYATVQIGTQCWMAENLRSTRYEDCNEIPLYTYAISINTMIPTPARFRPSNNASLVATQGYLYNGYTILGKGTSYAIANAGSSADPSGVQSICPAGWHIPSNAEWDRLANYLSTQSQYICGDNSSYILKSLAATSGWNSDNGECTVGNNQASNNATGFNALPVGIYAANLGWRYNGEFTYFGSTTSPSGGRDLSIYFIGTARATGGFTNMNLYNTGVSIRCVLDE